MVVLGNACNCYGNSSPYHWQQENESNSRANLTSLAYMQAFRCLIIREFPGLDLSHAANVENPGNNALIGQVRTQF